MALSWGAATDNVGVTKYNVHRSTTSGFTPATGNRIAQPTGLSYTNTGLAAGTYYYRVTAEDGAGNVGPASNQASALVTAADTTLPTVSITAPTAGATVSGITAVNANASDNVAVAGVQFRVDGVNVGAEDLTAPYSLSWDTRGASQRHPHAERRRARHEWQHQNVGFRDGHRRQHRRLHRRPARRVRPRTRPRGRSPRTPPATT